jgi:hypothetical protein
MKGRGSCPHPLASTSIISIPAGVTGQVFGVYCGFVCSGLLVKLADWALTSFCRLSVAGSRAEIGAGANSLWPYSMNGTRKPNRRWSRFPQLCSDYCWAGTMTAYASLRQRHLRRSVELHLLTAPDGSTKSYPDALNRRTQMTLIRKVRECGIFSVGCFSRF